MCELFWNNTKSEKKYKHKAAQEYRKHLTKILNEEQQLQSHQSSKLSRSRSEDEARGLDAILTGAKEPGLAPETVFTLPLSPLAATAPTATAAAAAAPKAIGTLDINAAVIKTADTVSAVSLESNSLSASSTDGPASAALIAESDPLKALAKLAGKKPSAVTAKRSLGAKKLSSSTAADTRMESFETVEKRSQLVAQEVEKKKQQQDSELSELSGIGRIGSLLRELDDSNKPSIYRSAPAATTSSHSPLYRTPSASNSAGYTATAANESFAARQKYGSAKGISSDQFFGRDTEEALDAQAKLQSYSHSSAISSDMLYGKSGGSSAGNYDPYSESATNANAAMNLDKLKDSVSGFFSNVQRRFA